MDNFSIDVKGQQFDFKKTKYGFYEVTPFVEGIGVEDLGNALLEQKGFYIAGFGQFNPIPVSEESGEEIIPFNVKNKCYFALIKESRNHN